MKELIERWRKDARRQPTDGDDCAAELQAWIDSLWTEITEDPATWPPERTPFALQYPDAEFSRICADVMHDTIRHYLRKAVMPYLGAKWRPIIPGIDTVDTIGDRVPELEDGE